jgi:pyridoxine 5-phosphate synthase
MSKHLRLGVNIDHIATVRNARGGDYPDPIRAAIVAQEAGAEGITAHLREDRRHISDNDLARLKEFISLPLNMEMAATDEMLAIALNTKPNACCIVPEKRQEVTTEGGLDVVAQYTHLKRYVDDIKTHGIRVSLFIDPVEAQIHKAAKLGADIVELHTGAYCDAVGEAREKHLKAIQKSATLCASLGMECHAGHGLSYQTVQPIAAIPEIIELNIGHFLISEAIFLGLDPAIRKMRALMDEA